MFSEDKETCWREDAPHEIYILEEEGWMERDEYIMANPDKLVYHREYFTDEAIEYFEQLMQEGADSRH